MTTFIVTWNETADEGGQIDHWIILSDTAKMGSYADIPDYKKAIVEGDMLVQIYDALKNYGLDDWTIKGCRIYAVEAAFTGELVHQDHEVTKKRRKALGIKPFETTAFFSGGRE